MDILKIKDFFKTLGNLTQSSLLSELQAIRDEVNYNLLENRYKQLNNKEGSCPHCQNLKYVKNGKLKGVQNYKCKKCNRSFTAYTGTWLAHIHKKDLLIPYLKLMKEGKTLDEIRDELKINKKTAFDWRHKIIVSISEIEIEPFIGITESDETFFLHSEKGESNLNREARKRGKSVSTRGISDKQVAVIVSADRRKTLNLKVSCLGRITKENINQAIGNMVNERTVLCSDGHVSYKGFALDKSLEHHVLKASLKEHVKEKKFHIQHVNSMYSRLKNWIDKRFLGVATKYLQNYMNWFHVKEKFKPSEFIKKVIELSTVNTLARNDYRNIERKYKLLMNLS